MIDLKCPYPEIAIELKKLPKENQCKILQAVSNLRLENMEPTRQTWINALDLETGRKTCDQICEEIIKKYKHA